MLDGVTPFPAEFAARYRELGYWEDRPLFDGFTAALAAYADRVAVVDETGPVTYRQLDERSEALAVPAAARGFDFAAMAADVMTDRPDLRLCLIQGLDEAPNDQRFVRLEDLLCREPRSSREALEQFSIDPSDPALFLLSGGTTGIPKLIP